VRRSRSDNDSVRRFATRRTLISPADISVFADDAREVDAETGSSFKVDVDDDDACRGRDRVGPAASELSSPSPSSSEEVSSQNSRIARGVRQAAGDFGGRSVLPPSTLESAVLRSWSCWGPRLERSASGGVIIT